MQNLNDNRLSQLYIGYLKTMSITLKLLAVGSVLICLTLLFSCNQPTGNSAANDNAQQMRERMDEKDSINNNNAAATAHDSSLIASPDSTSH